jgi:uncharacterized protein YndB with AHSA1/START domain
MPDILHRISIAASPAEVHELVTTTRGIERWWTDRPVKGDATVGGQLQIYIGRHDTPSAVMEVERDRPDEVVWRCVDGPDVWRNTRITFALQPTQEGGTTLLFTHSDWEQPGEFMAGCSTNWCAYLTSLKAGAEGDGFRPYPAGEISRW